MKNILPYLPWSLLPAEATNYHVGLGAHRGLETYMPATSSAPRPALNPCSHPLSSFPWDPEVLPFPLCPAIGFSAFFIDTIKN